MCTSTLSMAPYPPTSPWDGRGHCASKRYLISWCTDKFTEITLTWSFWGTWRHMIQIRSCMIFMTNQGPLHGKYHYAKSYVSRFILDHIFQGCTRLCPKWSVCHQSADRTRRSIGLPHPIPVTKLFQQWGLDVIREIFPHYLKEHCYILKSIYYFTRWIEAALLKQVNDQGVISFLQQNIILWFGISVSLLFENQT